MVLFLFSHSHSACHFHGFSSRYGVSFSSIRNSLTSSWSSQRRLSRSSYQRGIGGASGAMDMDAPSLLGRTGDPAASQRLGWIVKSTADPTSNAPQDGPARRALIQELGRVRGPESS